MFAHLGGTFLAAVASTFISKEKTICFIIGSVFTLFGLINLYQLPHPMWFNIEAVLYLPSAYLGCKLVDKINGTRKESEKDEKKNTK